MKLNFALLVAVFFCTNTCLAYNIKTDDFNIKTDEVSVIQKETQNAGIDTLIVFDIDGVLLDAKDQILKMSSASEYDEIAGSYSYIMLNNTADQLSDKQLKNEIKKAIDSGVLTRDAYLYQYITNTNVFRGLYIQKNGKVSKNTVIITANNGENLAKIINELGLSTTKKCKFKRLALDKIKIITAKTNVIDGPEKFNEEEKLTKEELKNEKKRRLEEKNFYSMRMMQSQEVPVDQGMPGLIKGLQASGKKVLALTLINSGSYGQIASMEKFRVNRLILAGYRFDKSWSGVKKQLLNQEKDVVFSKGVVLTNFSPKGDALMAFLQYAKNKPKKIILIDDRRINLKSVEAVARKNNIQFLGIEYMAAVDAKKEPINIKRARLQLDIFKKKHKWLSDGEADKYILTHSSIK